MTRPRLYAWAHGLTPEHAAELAEQIPGLGLVLPPAQLDAAAHLQVAPIAYLTTPEAARRAGFTAKDPTAAPLGLKAALINDERNADGPSGDRLEPSVYARQFFAAEAELPHRVPVFTMGLQAIGGPLRTLLRARLFDDAYHRQLPPADGRAFNPNKVRLEEVYRAMRLAPDHQWILSPAPFRGWLDQLLSPVRIRGWAELARDPRITAVALWCLQETRHAGGWQSEHGLFDRAGEITNVGRAVKRELARG